MKKVLSLAVVSLLLSGCATTNRPYDPADPYQNFNRASYAFNEHIDNYVLEPVANVYSKIMPWPAKDGVTNFFNNINEIPTIFNDLLQGNFYQATSDTWRLAVNSTLGIGGLFDVASHMSLQKNNEDFGLTLAKWGYTNSNYLVLPFLGPSTVRDTLGLPVNYVISIYPYIETNTGFALYATDVVNRRSNLLPYDSVLKQAFDPYVFVRDAYLQRRNKQITQNNTGHPRNDRVATMQTGMNPE